MALSLADEELPQVKVHATAVISMLNHFVRRDNRDSRVIGTLLGVANGRVLEVMDCYAVPFQESKGSEKLYVGIDEEFHKSMFSFSKRVNKKEQVLGWYASTTPSGALIIDQSSLINDFYTRKSEFGATNPIHLVVDTTLTGDDVKVRGFVSKPVKVGAANLANCFLELDVEVMMSDAETTALYHMIHGQAEGTVFLTSEIVSRLSSEKERLAPALRKLIATTEDLQKYCSLLEAGKVQAPAGLGMSLSDALNGLSSLQPEELRGIINDRTADLLLVSYLSTLTQTQLNVSEKLSALL